MSKILPILMVSEVPGPSLTSRHVSAAPSQEHVPPLSASISGFTARMYASVRNLGKSGNTNTYLIHKNRLR